MKLVIDVPKEMYDWFNNGFPDEDVTEVIIKAEENTKEVISLNSAIEAIAMVDPTNGDEPYFTGNQIINLLKNITNTEKKER